MQNKEESPEQSYPGSVLLADLIKKHVDDNELIVTDPFYEPHELTFDEKQLKRAKYDVRLGKKYYKGGGFKDLDEESHPFLEVEPYELVFVESYEVFNMPNNVVGKYDIRVRSCVEGIGLQTGLQVDPTYYGRIFCPLFNFSDEKVTLKYKDHLASIQFLYTTPSTREAEKYLAFDEKRREKFCLIQVLESPRRSGLEKLWTSIQKTEKALEGELLEFRDTATHLHTRVDTMVSAVFEAMAFMIGALGVTVAAIAVAISAVVTSGAEKRPLFIALSVLIGVAIAFGVFAFIRKRIRKILEHK